MPSPPVPDLRPPSRRPGRRSAGKASRAASGSRSSGYRTDAVYPPPGAGSCKAALFAGTLPAHGSPGADSHGRPAGNTQDRIFRVPPATEPAHPHGNVRSTAASTLRRQPATGPFRRKPHRCRAPIRPPKTTDRALRTTPRAGGAHPPRSVRLSNPRSRCAYR